MERLRKAKNSLYEAGVMAYMDMREAVLHPAKWQRVTAFILVFLTVFSGMMMTVCADDLQTKVGDMMKSGYSMILAVTSGIAVVCLAIALLGVMFSTNPQSSRTCTQWIKRIAIAWVGVNLLGAVATTIYNLSDGSGFGDIQTKEDTFS